jgi:hypothetical protein
LNHIARPDSDLAKERSVIGTRKKKQKNFVSLLWRRRCHGRKAGFFQKRPVKKWLVSADFGGVLGMLHVEHWGLFLYLTYCYYS